jgi:cytochrome P450
MVRIFPHCFESIEPEVTSFWMSQKSAIRSARLSRCYSKIGDGPRFCPGRNLAMLEMQMVLAMVCRTFRMEKPQNGKTPKSVFKFVVAPEDLWVRLEPITSK